MGEEDDDEKDAEDNLTECARTIEDGDLEGEFHFLQNQMKTLILKLVMHFHILHQGRMLSTSLH